MNCKMPYESSRSIVFSHQKNNYQRAKQCISLVLPGNWGGLGPRALTQPIPKDPLKVLSLVLRNNSSTDT